MSSVSKWLHDQKSLAKGNTAHRVHVSCQVKALLHDKSTTAECSHCLPTPVGMGASSLPKEEEDKGPLQEPGTDVSTPCMQALHPNRTNKYYLSQPCEEN